MKYRCKTADSAGKKHRILEEAPDRIHLARKLSERGLFLIEARKVSGDSRGRISPKALLELTDTLALLSRSGLSLKDAFLLSTEVLSGSARRLAGQLSRRMQQGERLSTLVEEYGGIFPPLYAGMIAVGEDTGRIETVLDRLSDYLNRRATLREKTVTALIYPSLVLAVTLIGMVLMLIFLFPAMESIFSRMGTEGEMTRLIDGTRHFIQGFILVLGSCGGLLLLSWLWGRKSAAWRRFGAGILLKLPLIGPWIVQKETMNFVFSMEVLTGGGIPLEKALDQSIRVVRHLLFQEALANLRNGVKEGENLSDQMALQGLFPPRVVSWIRIGENSGEVSGVFRQLKTYYAAENDKTGSRFTALIEPTLIVVSGVFIVVLILLFIVPLLTLFSSGGLL